MSETPVIADIRDVTFSYGREAVLADVNLTLRQGDFIAMIGPNGGGKTTLLKLILGLLSPDAGSIQVFGQPASQAAPRIGYVPQEVNINPRFPISAIDVVLMGMLAPGRRWSRTSAADRREAMTALERMGMGAFAETRVGELSGGQRQRVFIARALVTRPRFLLLDEPTASIDAQGQTEFYRSLKALNHEVTILVVSHDLLVVSRYAKSVACVNRRVHYHPQSEITADMLETMYPCADDEACPVELVAHGLPHRVLRPHQR